jgi:hypothetical protein
LFTLLALSDIDPWVRMRVALGTSLASIVVTSLISVRSHLRRSAVADYMATTSPEFRLRDNLPRGVAGQSSGFLIGGLSAI